MTVLDPGSIGYDLLTLGSVLCVVGGMGLALVALMVMIEGADRDG